MSVTSPFPYTFKDEYENSTAVFKLWFGNRYFIFKGLKLKATVEALSAQIHRERLKSKDDSILVNVIAYINKARVTSMTVERLYESDAIADVLMSEYEALQKAKKDSRCLNARFTNNDYYPKWVPQIAINEFAKLLQGAGMTDKERNLRRFLGKYTKKPEYLQKIVEYINERYR